MRRRRARQWRRPRRRQLLDERILALEEAEREQLVGVAQDHDPVCVGQLAGRRQRGGEPPGSATIVVSRGRRFRAAAEHLRQLEAEDREQDDRADGENCFWRLALLLGQRLHGRRCSCSGGGRARRRGRDRLRALGRRRWSGSRWRAGGGRAGREPAAPCRRRRRRRRRSASPSPAGTGAAPWSKAIELTEKRRPVASSTPSWTPTRLRRR